jgi:hypothetical protein
MCVALQAQSMYELHGHIHTSLRCFSGIFSRLLRLGPARTGTAAPSVVVVALLSVVVAAVSPSAVISAGSFCGAAASACCC